MAEDAVGEVSDDERVGGRANGSPIKGKGRGGEKRPMVGRLRRRSTLEWASATPQRRQEKLERVTEERMADVFFTLHVGGVEGW